MGKEEKTVQDPLIHYAGQIGWHFVNARSALQRRGGPQGRFFRDTLEEQLIRLNPGLVNDERASEIANLLARLPASIEGNRQALSWLRGEQSLYIPAEKRERNIRLIDFDQLDNNIFAVTKEWSQRNDLYTNRADIIFLINGLPVAIVETKKATLAEGLSLGVDQLRRYHRETPEMLVIPQVFVVTQLFDLYYGATWNTDRNSLFNWKEVVGPLSTFEQKVCDFFDRRRFLRVLRDYLIFLTRDDQLSKVILRQHQMRAVEKVVARVEEGQKRRGLIWHTQGSGKTLTMLTIAARLLHAPQREKPTVIMVVDRNELEQQLFKNIQAYGLGSAKVAESKKDLQDILDSDYRGLVVTMIHKFDGIRPQSNPRKSIVVLVDEAHRSTGGELGTELMAALPNATYIGFTGTPIDRLSRGQGTFKVFGCEDPEGYLDKYSIADSIADGTTVALNYALAPSALRVDRQTLEREFLELTEAQGVSDIQELNAILDRAVKLKEMMKAPERVDAIARFVAEHFLQNVHPMGFKAFLVAVDREACVLYKRALERYLPVDWIEAVYSPSHKDSGDLKALALSEDQERAIRRDFLQKQRLPKILIVTEKLLTGYDAPILYCLYLDKPMRDHVLLQAIARVNRPYEDGEGQVKPYGFILDFVGLFDQLEKALAFDSDIVQSVIQDIEILKQLFASWMQNEAQPHLAYARALQDDQGYERALEYYFDDKQRRQDFLTFFRRLQNLYEVIAPDAFLHPYLEDYQALAELYAIVRRDLDLVPVDHELTAKTKALLRSRTSSSTPTAPEAVRELSIERLQALKNSRLSSLGKIINLRKLLSLTVETKARQEPHLVSIGERAEEVAREYEARHVATQQALDEYEKLAEEYLHASEERQRLGLNPNAFAIYQELRRQVVTASPQQAQALDEAFRHHPDYEWNPTEESQLRAELYRLLYPVCGVTLAVSLASKLLRLERVKEA
ncbi:type I restriction endonuclease subunit R [Thermogemmatispora onikobensis]|uniref:type I restriction endonuclease subunit R n=1 Tax=Thermogemmatispora onikobensis TaxID=732234 RepID=UPI000A525F4E|nr:HsdR family type I site-specific deoxyribonuclease [Thermogemmatispora onikobensis]